MAKKHGVPYCIAYSHSTIQEKKLKYPLKLLYKRQIPRCTDKMFVCSQVSGEWMFGGAPFVFLNNAERLEEFNRAAWNGEIK